MMATTTMISSNEKPRARRRPAKRLAWPDLLVEIPVTDVGIFAFAAFLAIGADRIQVVIQAALARENVLVGIATGIGIEAPQVATFAPVADRGIVRTLHQGLQAEIRARVLV